MTSYMFNFYYELLSLIIIWELYRTVYETMSVAYVAGTAVDRVPIDILTARILALGIGDKKLRTSSSTAAAIY
jgi:hypothetical protein